MTRKVVLSADTLEAVTLPSSEDNDKLKFTRYGVIYLTRDSKDPHSIYKLHMQNSIDSKEERYIWIAMWNSAVWTVYPDKDKKKKYYYTSIEEAVRCALLNGNKVRQVSIKNLQCLEWVFTENI